MIFEPLKFEHLEQMAEIEREAFDTPWTVNMFIPEVTAEGATYLVGTRDGEVLCYGGFHFVVDEAHITNIAVKQTERGRGLGKMLLATLLDKAKEKGAKKVSLEVKITNYRAVDLYKNFGFEIVGIRKKYYNNKYDAILMTKIMPCFISDACEIDK